MKQKSNIENVQNCERERTKTKREKKMQNKRKAKKIISQGRYDREEIHGGCHGSNTRLKSMVENLWI